MKNRCQVLVALFVNWRTFHYERIFMYIILFYFLYYFVVCHSIEKEETARRLFFCGILITLQDRSKFQIDQGNVI